jgi:hypothetical protein
VGKKGKECGAHIPERATKTRRRLSLIVYFLSISDGIYIVQTVYFQVTAVY